jgi:hypothetical protein
VGLLFDHMYCLLNKVSFCSSRSAMNVLKASIEWVLGFVAVVSDRSLMMLKSPSSNQGRPLRQYMVLISVRKSFFRSLSTGP